MYLYIYLHIYIFILYPAIYVFFQVYLYLWGFPGDSVRKNPPASAGDAEDVGFIPGSGRSPGIGNGNPF